MDHCTEFLKKLISKSFCLHFPSFTKTLKIKRKSVLSWPLSKPSKAFDIYWNENADETWNSFLLTTSVHYIICGINKNSAWEANSVSDLCLYRHKHKHKRGSSAGNKMNVSLKKIYLNFLLLNIILLNITFYIIRNG